MVKAFSSAIIMAWAISLPLAVKADTLDNCPNSIVPGELVKETLDGKILPPEQRCVLARNPDLHALPPEDALRAIELVLEILESQNLESLDPNFEPSSDDLEAKLTQFYPDGLLLHMVSTVSRNPDILDAVLRISTVDAQKMRDLIDIIFPRN